MGKGDRKTRRGKITLGSYGVRRPRKKNKAIVTKPANDKVESIVNTVTEEQIIKKDTKKTIKNKKEPTKKTSTSKKSK